MALGKAYFKRLGWAKVQALILFVCYIAYIFIYNVPSAVGFFVMEIDAQEQAASKVEIAEMVNRQRLDQIAQTIDNLNLQLTKEAETGYGRRSKAIMAQLDKLNRERVTLQESFIKQVVTRNVFKSLEDVAGVPANRLKVIIFSTSIIMLCLILIITSWDVTVTSNTATRRVTRRVTSSDMGTCKRCGDPVKDGREYCSKPACRVAASREKKKLADSLINEFCSCIC